MKASSLVWGQSLPVGAPTVRGDPTRGPASRSPPSPSRSSDSRRSKGQEKSGEVVWCGGAEGGLGGLPLPPERGLGAGRRRSRRQAGGEGQPAEETPRQRRRRRQRRLLEPGGAEVWGGEGARGGRDGAAGRWGRRAGGRLQLPPASRRLQAAGRTQRRAIQRGAARGRASPGPSPGPSPEPQPRPEPRAPSELGRLCRGVPGRVAAAGKAARAEQVADAPLRPPRESFPRGRPQELARGPAAAAAAGRVYPEASIRRRAGETLGPRGRQRKVPVGRGARLWRGLLLPWSARLGSWNLTSRTCQRHRLRTSWADERSEHEPYGAQDSVLLTPGELPRPITMEGDCLNCMKYLMFVFNFFIFLGGACLLGVGIWVMVDPTGFREIVAATPLLVTGAYILLAMGGLLFLLGFLGCCGAVRENKCLLLFFFLFILIIFLAELSAAILAFIFRENLTREFFTKELTKHYQGNNDTDVFSATWNSVMITFGCCGVNGPEDFKVASVFRLLALDSEEVPEACCRREPQARAGVLLSREECLLGRSPFLNKQGCYTVILNAFETYVYLAGALAIGVLAIELCVMVFAMCLFRGIQ